MGRADFYIMIGYINQIDSLNRLTAQQKEIIALSLIHIFTNSGWLKLSEVTVK